tara:strand:+ start:883 stop:1179 length:297 start_codon:yes stop_codon:yes gene_type:complete
MKENKVYWNKNNTCKRIIKAFRQSEKKQLSTHQIYTILLEQKNSYGGKLRTCPSRHSLAQTLSKFPYFSKAGITSETSIGNNGMKVCVWKLSALGEEE